MAKTLRDGPIVRGTVPFVVIKEIGELGDSNRKVMSVGYTGKQTGSEEYPLASLSVTFIENLKSFVHWPNREAAEKDLGMLKEYVDSLQIKSKKEPNDGTRSTTPGKRRNTKAGNVAPRRRTQAREEAAEAV